MWAAYSKDRRWGKSNGPRNETCNFAGATGVIPLKECHSMQDVPSPGSPPPETPTPPAEPAQPSQPAQPTAPPVEAPQTPPDIDIPAPGTQPPGSADG